MGKWGRQLLGVAGSALLLGFAPRGTPRGPLPAPTNSALRNARTVGMTQVGPTTTRVTPVVLLTIPEAVAVAKWFARCVDLPTDLEADSVSLGSNSFGGISLYSVRLQCSGPRIYDFTIDAYSGDVTSANFREFSGTRVPELTQQEAIWLKRIGRFGELRGDPMSRRFAATIDKQPFFNFGGASGASFQSKDGKFSWYEGLGEPPPRPYVSPSVSRERAIELAAATVRPSSNGTPTASLRAELGLFYDDTSERTRWVWRVSNDAHANDPYAPFLSHYVDASSAQVIPLKSLENSRWPYQSRRPRQGLELLHGLKAKLPLYDVAQKYLKEMNRNDVVLESMQLGNGARFMGSRGATLNLGQNGELLRFDSYGPSGKVDDATALRKGRRFIENRHLKLPEGAYVGNRSSGSDGNSVRFTQRALGYYYFGRPVAFVGMGEGGVVTQYMCSGSQPLPLALPAKIVSVSEVEGPLQALVNTHLPKDEANIHYYATVKAENLGWCNDPVTGRIRLCYDVVVWTMRDIKNYAVQGGGNYYKCDAETGKCLQKFP